MSRIARAALLALAAGVLAAPAAGQSSAWHNPPPGDAAQTSRPFDATSRQLLAVACAGGALIVMESIVGPLADVIANEAGLSAGGVDAVRLAWRFDGRPESETVTDGLRAVAPGEISIALYGADAAHLAQAMRAAQYVETAPPGGKWQRRWSLRRSNAAIGRLPCMDGAS